MDAAGGGMRCAEEAVVGVDPVRSPYPAVVDPSKRRMALREYVRQLAGDNKENERGKECEGGEKSPGLVKQKTLGLCRRHVGAVVVTGDGMLRDKRKFNAPRQTPEKRQRPDQESPGTEGPRIESRVDASEEMVMRQPVFSFASREHVQLESGGRDGGAPWSQFGGKDGFASPAPSPSRQAQLPESYTLPFKWQAPEPNTPSVRKPLAPVNIPVNRQTVDLYASPMDQQLPSRPNSSGSSGPASSGSLFQTASGKPFQASDAAKARAALLFKSDAELAEFFSMDL